MAATDIRRSAAAYERAPLDVRYWSSFALLGGVYVLDFCDFFLIASSWR